MQKVSANLYILCVCVLCKMWLGFCVFSQYLLLRQCFPPSSLSHPLILLPFPNFSTFLLLFWFRSFNPSFFTPVRPSLPTPFFLFLSLSLSLSLFQPLSLFFFPLFLPPSVLRSLTLLCYRPETLSKRWHLFVFHRLSRGFF